MSQNITHTLNSIMQLDEPSEDLLPLTDTEQSVFWYNYSVSFSIANDYSIPNMFVF